MALAKDDFDRWVDFCNNTEAWDKVWKIFHSGVRITVDLSPSETYKKNADFLWRYILDARKLSWWMKWIKEAQGMRAALRVDEDRTVARLKAMVRFWFAGRWIFENFHIATKFLPNQIGNIFKVKDPMRLNRLAKFCWQMALITNVTVDLKVLQLNDGKETADQKKMRRLRLIQAFGDSQICLNMMQVPQMVTGLLLGKEKAYYDTWVGLNGFTAAALQCYFVYPARPKPKAVEDKKEEDKKKEDKKEEAKKK